MTPLLLSRLGVATRRPAGLRSLGWRVTPTGLGTWPGHPPWEERRGGRSSPHAHRTGGSSSGARRATHRHRYLFFFKSRLAFFSRGAHPQVKCRETWPDLHLCLVEYFEL